MNALILKKELKSSIY